METKVKTRTNQKGHTRKAYHRVPPACLGCDLNDVSSLHELIAQFARVPVLISMYLYNNQREGVSLYVLEILTKTAQQDWSIYWESEIEDNEARIGSDVRTGP